MTDRDNSICRLCGGCGIGMVLFAGLLLAIIAWIFSCAPARPPVRFDAPDTIASAPWPEPTPIRIIMLNRTAGAIYHGYEWGASEPFLWGMTTVGGIAELHVMTGANVPAPPCTVVVKETGGRI